VHSKFNRPDISLHGPDDQASYMEIACTSSTVRPSAFRVRTLQSLIMVITCRRSATVRTLGQNRPDVALLWKAFNTILERRLQLTVRTLGQAVRTPSGILDINFYSNIGLGRNWRRWKDNEIFCKLNVRTEYVPTETFSRPDGPAENFRIIFWTRKTWPVWTVLAPVRTRMPQTLFLTRFWVSKAYK
jgi:hypothetical protein